MEIIKYQTNQVLPHIKHDLRSLPEGKAYGNESINPALSNQNYSIISRGSTPKEVNDYRKKIESECFKYNRKDYVKAVEVCIQCPSDCPIEQHELFFREAHNYICSTLPMGEKCVFVSEVHKDEEFYSPTGDLVSKEHLHIMYVPAVPDNKHEGYEYKLCADQLTRKSNLRELHPGLQQHLDECGIQATVVKKKSNNSRTIPLSVKQLKEITRATGVTIDHSLTVEDFSEIIKKNIELSTALAELKAQITPEVSRWNRSYDHNHEVSRW